MPRTPASTIVSDAPTIASTADYWRSHLRAEGKRERTLITYLGALEKLDRFLAEKGMPRALAGIRREHVEAFIVDLQDRGASPASVSLYFRALRPFFAWLAEEDEIARSPMEKMSVPAVPVNPPAVLGDEEAGRLFAVVRGTDFESRRDNAILRLFYDTGLRRGELAALRLADLDLRGDDGMLFVEASTSKSRRGRAVSFGDQTRKALHRYLRHPRAPKHPSDPLWLGRTGLPLAGNAILQMVRRRGQQAGIPDLHPHIFRHTWAHVMLGPGEMSEGDVMKLGGWSTRDMLSRYGASAAEERARAAYRGRAPGDLLTRRTRH